jgi:hypothetical protein
MTIEEIKKKKFFYKKNDFHKYHLVGILENEPQPQVIYKYFGRYKQWWHYEIKSLYIFKISIKDGYYYFKD